MHAILGEKHTTQFYVGHASLCAPPLHSRTPVVRFSNAQQKTNPCKPISNRRQFTNLGLGKLIAVNFSTFSEFKM
jgi:hypothetical protein